MENRKLGFGLDSLCCWDHGRIVGFHGFVATGLHAFTASFRTEKGGLKGGL